MGVFRKRGYWVVRFEGRQFKFATEDQALKALEVLEVEGLPNR